MVKKILTLVSITALTGIVSAAGAVGCSSEDDPATPAADAGKDAKTRAETGPTPDDDAGEPTGCYAEDEASILSDKVTAKFPGKKCSAQEVDDVVADCFGKEATEETCKAFQTDHASCIECVLGPAKAADTFDLPAFLSLEEGGLISINACLAIALNKPECAIPLTNVTFCSVTACAACEEDAESDECSELAQAGICGQIEVSEACVAVGQTEDTAAIAKCYTEGDSLGSLKKTVNTLCNVGTGGGDGG